MTLSRREMLISAVLAPAAAIGRRDRFDGPDCVLDVFTDFDSARAVGEAYLASYPVNVRSLDALVFDRLNCVPGDVPKLSAVDLRKLTRNAIRTDFEAGRTVSVGGWVLSETEARVCAIYALAATTGDRASVAKHG